MAAINLHYPKMKVFQKTSTQVAAGAKIYTYLAGTSTDKPTYSDQALTVANANPVIADSNGEAQVWLKDDALYKIVINDSSDVLISSTDNVGSLATTTITQGNYNSVNNGSVETDTDSDGVPDDWTLSITSGSTIAIDATDQAHGLNSLKFVGGSSGAGTATSAFFSVQASKELGILFSLKASLATVTQTVKILWYTSAKAAASVASTTVYNVTTTAPTTWTEQVLTATAGSDAKYGKIEISGSSSSGTTNYDDIWVGDNIIYGDAVQTLSNKTLLSPALTSPTLTSPIIDGTGAIFEGSTADAFETTLTVTDPTADRVVTIQDSTDTLVGRATTDTLTNKSVDANNNTVTNLDASTLDFTLATGGSWTISLSGNQVVPAGLYMCTQTSGSAGLGIDINQASSWRTGLLGWVGGLILSDGTNVRIFGNGADSSTVYYRQFA